MTARTAGIEDATLASEIASRCALARRAARSLGPRERAIKDQALRAIAAGLRARKPEILEQNALDLENARQRGTRGALLDRLALDDKRLEAMAVSVEEVAELPDPVGGIIEQRTLANGIELSRVRVPLGVVAMIYEARPNVTVEASTLCLKSGNAIVLRGGSEALHSNRALAAVIADALEATGLPRDAVQVIPFTDRDAVRVLVQQSETVDLVIPRGGEALIRFVTEHARVPVVQHYKGVCHLYLDAGCDLDMAEKLVVNGKLSRPGVCNALECLLVDEADAARTLPKVAAALLAGGCELRGDERTRALVPEARPATDEDWGTEFLDRVLAVRVVSGLDGALEHIARFGSGHTEAICTKNDANAERFRREVDAACVAVNASTRFHDGGELGLGAEIGIATSRLHWRGPMGLEALTTMKWLLNGSGQTR
ncbi:glutamate-5-semialdehyde dehydrogenase [Pendulispora rubella]|uniref:Gamma-glutamyl phosphate reductase n=1 Tax=Pendulispora rubella TaxID=2741070 RepID=A0ABZ2LAI6_9BACT